MNFLKGVNNGTFIFSFSIINSNNFNMGREVMKISWTKQYKTKTRIYTLKYYYGYAEPRIHWRKI